MKTKTLLSAILFALSVSAFAQNTASCNCDCETVQQHKGFYMAFAFGVGTNIYDIETERKSDFNRDYGYFANKSITKDDYIGYGTPVLDFKLGGAASNLIALYSEIGFSLFTGTLNHSKESFYKENVDFNYNLSNRNKDKYKQVYQVRYFFGAGTTIYPFREPGAANGFFIGGSIGYTYVSDDEYGFSGIERTFKGEIGKDWWISNKMSFGVGAQYMYSTPLEQNISSSSDHTIALLIRVVRG